MNQLRLLAILAALAFGALSGCGDSGTPTASGSGTSPTKPPAAVPASVTIGTNTLAFNALRTTQALTAVIRDASGNSINSPITWTVAQPAVASVSAEGVVTAIADGETTVTASAGPATATVSVRVRQIASRINISGGAPRLLGTRAAIQLRAAVVDSNTQPVVGATVTWSSSDSTIATIDNAGRLSARRAGSVRAIAASGGLTATLETEVVALQRFAIDPYLATPIANAVWEIPVAIVSYIPTNDGVNVDVAKAPDFYTLGPITIAQLETRLLDIFRRKKMALEQGSRYRAYLDPAARPSIGIRVVEHITVYDQLPATPRVVGTGVNAQFVPDYKLAFRENGLESLIPSRTVKQVWLAQSSFSANFPSYNPTIHNLQDTRWVAESNMSSPTTGDISNSFREPDDLPIFGHTYVVYGINFRRSQAEAVHNVGHQLEATLSYVNQRFEGNTRLFWNKFVGLDSGGKFIKGRAGATHFPPNANSDYDYNNTVATESDIEDWKPDGTGARKSVSASTWGGRLFPWPGATEFEQRVETQWYIYWFQSMPGLGNTIPLGSGTMTNWWYFFADWDAANRSSTALATVRDGSPISIRNDYRGGVLLDPGGGLATGQSVVLYSDRPITVGVYDCGEPGASGCIFDRYVLQPGRSYRVIQSESGPVNNLTIIER